MKILPNWLREFVDVPVDDRQLATDLTAAGIAVEGYSTEAGQVVYEIEITPNRVDAMSHYGVAREVAAIYDHDLKPLEPKLPTTDAGRSHTSKAKQQIADEDVRATRDQKNTQFPIIIEDPQGCARYTARVIRNVTIGPSPVTISDRLETLGSRAIHHAADATNHKPHDVAHPTHPFPLAL